MGIEKTRPAAVDAGQTLEMIRMGAPPAKYTPALHQHICENIKKGNRPVTAAQMAGISSHTFYRWMNMGKAGDPHLFDFANDVEQAVAIFEGRMAEKVVEDAENDAKSAQWLLERRFPEGYSKEVDAKVTAIMANFMAALKDGLSDLEYYKVLAISSGMTGSESVPQLPPGPDEQPESEIAQEST